MTMKIGLCMSLNSVSPARINIDNANTTAAATMGCAHWDGGIRRLSNQAGSRYTAYAAANPTIPRVPQ